MFDNPYATVDLFSLSLSLSRRIAEDTRVIINLLYVATAQDKKIIHNYLNLTLTKRPCLPNPCTWLTRDWHALARLAFLSNPPSTVCNYPDVEKVSRLLQRSARVSKFADTLE